MAQAGFTPISIYYSSTASAVPLAANLAFGELALNILDGNLYYKNSVGAVTLLSSSAIVSGSFTNLSYSNSLIGSGPATITATSTLAALRVTQLGTGNALLVEDSSNPDSTPFVIDQNGAVGIGGNPSSDTNLYNTKDLSGVATYFSTAIAATVRSSVTTAAYAYSSVLATESAAFTLATLVHYSAGQSTFANTAVTTQAGFQAQSNLISAVNNYGFFGNIPAGSNRYNLYCAGTANNYMAGSLGIGGLPSAGQTLFLNQSITGNANSSAVRQQGTVNLASVTTSCLAFDNVSATTAGTLTTYIHYNAQQSTFAGGAIVTNQLGFASGSTLIGATNNFGFYASDTAAVTAGRISAGFYSLVNAASGGGTTYGFWAAGTAQNLFNGRLTVTAGAQTTSVAATQAGASITINCALSNVFTTTLSASITSLTFSNLSDGQTINWFITKPAGGGGPTVAWASSTPPIRWPGGIAGVLSTGANAVDLVVLTYRSGPNVWYATLTKTFS
jgi:hypothetical protein